MRLLDLRMKSRVVIALLCFGVPASCFAQVETKKNTTEGASSVQVNVERGEVVSVDGNDLVVKMEDGTVRHFPNVPDRATVTVDGKQLGIHDLKPGMKLQRTITTTTTPMTVTTVQTVTGKIWNVVPPLSVTLTMENGENQTFKIPSGQKFNVDGQMVDAFALKKGMKITATKITEVPGTVVTQQKAVSGTMPPAAAILIADESSATEAATAPPSTTPAETPPAPVETPAHHGRYLWIVLALLALLAIVWMMARGKRRT